MISAVFQAFLSEDNGPPPRLMPVRPRSGPRVPVLFYWIWKTRIFCPHDDQSRSFHPAQPLLRWLSRGAAKRFYGVEASWLFKEKTS
jgi:hypothetical protein